MKIEDRLTSEELEELELARKIDKDNISRRGVRKTFGKNQNSRYKKVASLLKEGKTTDDIMSELGLTRKQVHSDTYRARLLNEVAEFKPMTAVDISTNFVSYKNRINKLGRMKEFYRSLTKDERKWLMKEVPPGMTVAEFFVLLLRDAIAEDGDTK